jgi:hypothetical protein
VKQISILASTVFLSMAIAACLIDDPATTTDELASLGGGKTPSGPTTNVGGGECLPEEAERGTCNSGGGGTGGGSTHEPGTSCGGNGCDVFCEWTRSGECRCQYVPLPPGHPGCLWEPPVDESLTAEAVEKFTAEAELLVSLMADLPGQNIITPCDPVADPHCERSDPGPGGGAGGGGGGGSGGGGGQSGGGGWLCTAPGYRWMARYGQCVYVGQPCNGLCDVANQGVCIINANYICECSGGTGC